MVTKFSALKNAHLSFRSCFRESYILIQDYCALSFDVQSYLLYLLSNVVSKDSAMGKPVVDDVQMGDAEAGTSRKVAPITDFGKVCRKRFIRLVSDP